MKKQEEEGNEGTGKSEGRNSKNRMKELEETNRGIGRRGYWRNRKKRVIEEQKEENNGGIGR